MKLVAIAMIPRAMGVAPGLQWSEGGAARLRTATGRWLGSRARGSQSGADPWERSPTAAGGGLKDERR